MPRSNDFQRSLVVKDLLNVIDYNPKLGVDEQFYGPIAGLEKNEKNMALLTSIKTAMDASLKLWLKEEHGYTLKAGKYVNANNEELTKPIFQTLRDDKDKGLSACLSKAFAEDLAHNNYMSPGA